MRWEQGRAAIDAMIASGKLDRVRASRELADMMLAQARTHLQTAAAIADADPAAAFQTAYDAARKALAAVLENQGLRVKAGAGAHVALNDVVRAQLHPPMGTVLDHFTWLRRTRNNTEYPTLETPTPTSEDIQDAIPLAADIVELAEKVIPQMQPY